MPWEMLIKNTLLRRLKWVSCNNFIFYFFLHHFFFEKQTEYLFPLFLMISWSLVIGFIFNSSSSLFLARSNQNPFSTGWRIDPMNSPGSTKCVKQRWPPGLVILSKSKMLHTVTYHLAWTYLQTPLPEFFPIGQWNRFK